jgi:hypothetical protein
MTARWIVCCGFFLVLGTSYSGASSEQTAIDDEARSVTAGCPDAMRAGNLQTFDAGMCLGIIKGLHYLSRDICIPPATSLGQIAGVVSKYSDSHSGQVPDADFRETSLAAMRSAWPCRGKHDI